MGGDGGRLGHKLAVFLLKAQQVPKTLVFPAGGLSLPGFGLKAGVFLPQRFQLLGQNLPLKGIGLDPLGPGNKGVDAVAEGGGNNACQIHEGVGKAPEGKGKHRRDET